MARWRRLTFADRYAAAVRARATADRALLTDLVHRFGARAQWDEVGGSA